MGNTFNAYFIPKESDNEIKLEGSFFGHTIKKLNETSLKERENEREKIKESKEFTKYKNGLELSKNTIEECSLEEKMMVLWRLLLKNTRFAKEKEIRLRLFLAKFTGQDLNTLKKNEEEGKGKTVPILRAGNCIAYAFMYKTLVDKFLGVKGTVEFAEYHTYFKGDNGIHIDFSDLAIQGSEKLNIKSPHGYFATKEEHDLFLKKFMGENPKYELAEIIKKTATKIKNIFSPE